MSTNDGGPAFPQPCTEGGYSANSPYGIAGGGCSMRTYFAAKAMQAILHTSMRAAGSDGSVSFDLVAAAAYRMADEMLKAREAA